MNRLDLLIERVKPIWLGDETNGFFGNDPEPLQEFLSVLKKFFQRFGIGTKISKKKWGKTRTKKIQDALYKAVDQQTLSPQKSPSELMKDIKKKMGKAADKFSDHDFRMVARTEAAAMRAAYQLMKAKQAGFTHVRHVTKNDSRVSEICRKHHNRVFKIDYLLEHDEHRIPLHPGCRCSYKLARR